MAPSINVILGAASIGDSAASKFPKFDTPEQVNSLLNLFYERGYRHIDTARGYAPGAPGTSEPRLGAVDAGKRFTIDTKAMAAGDHPHSKDKIIENVDVSVKELRIPQVNVYYLHMPDRTTPLEEAVAGMDAAYKAGKIKQFGVSNHTPDEVEQLVKISEEKGYIKPTVYQGQYNAIVRGGEKDLFPVLRKHNIAFYAYSPAGGGFFAGNHKGSNTRFDRSLRVGEVYSNYYCNPQLEEAFQRASAAGDKHGISGHAAALRWTAYHSILDPKFGDAIILGASTVDQMKQNLDILDEGPLPEEVAAAVGAVYSYVGDGEIKPYM
ncbi:hypothetical protein N0V82_007620 [Gnomoniopsis sp. IMI 355080]|nr:hypothetical protein N0V82_007620 [Gnomoniopsis sp. IMI 355080]